MPPIVSPCTRLCAIDPETRLCAGCGRTLEEIGHWVSYDDATRRAIMATLPDRLARERRDDRSEARLP